MVSILDKDAEESKTNLKLLLRQLFQFDNSDLDFGIYKIMNYKRKRIERFIEVDILEEIENQFTHLTTYKYDEKSELVENLKNRIIETLGDHFEKDGRVQERFRKFPIVIEYEKSVDDLGKEHLSTHQITVVYNYIYEFFSRYFENGDFISKRRYGGKNHYIMPYNGEETMFYWSNFDRSLYKNWRILSELYIYHRNNRN